MLMGYIFARVCPVIGLRSFTGISLWKNVTSAIHRYVGHAAGDKVCVLTHTYLLPTQTPEED